MQDTGVRRANTIALLCGCALALFQGLSYAAAAAEEGPSGGLRVYRERNSRGEMVLHVTNLDENGRRIGGETQPSKPDTAAATRCQEDPKAPAAAPIIINVYNLPPSQTAPDLSDGYGEYDVTEPWPPGYPVARFPAAYYRPHPSRTHGSAGPPAGLFGRPRVIDTRPYTRATAAQRNRAAFHRH